MNWTQKTMGKFIGQLLIVILMSSCYKKPTYHASLQTPMINGLTWCGRPFWSVVLSDQKQEYTIYNFEMNLWYGEPYVTCGDGYLPFKGLLHAHADRIELLPDSVHHFAKKKITVFRYDLAPNTIIDSSYVSDRQLMAYTKFIDAIPYCGDTLFKFEWNAMLYGYQEWRYSTFFYISKSRGLIGMYDYCNKEGGQVLCAIGHTPDKLQLPRDPFGIQCGAVE